MDTPAPEPKSLPENSFDLLLERQRELSGVIQDLRVKHGGLFLKRLTLALTGTRQHFTALNEEPEYQDLTMEKVVEYLTVVTQNQVIAYPKNTLEPGGVVYQELQRLLTAAQQRPKWAEYSNCGVPGKYEDVDFQELFNSTTLRPELTLSDLRDVRFVGCDFSYELLQHCDLDQAKFSECKLLNTVLKDCKARQTRFEYSDLESATLVTDFEGSWFHDCSFLAAHIYVQSQLRRVNFENCNFSLTRWPGLLNFAHAKFKDCIFQPTPGFSAGLIIFGPARCDGYQFVALDTRDYEFRDSNPVEFKRQEIQIVAGCRSFEWSEGLRYWFDPEHRFRDDNLEVLSAVYRLMQIRGWEMEGVESPEDVFKELSDEQVSDE